MTRIVPVTVHIPARPAHDIEVDHIEIDNKLYDLSFALTVAEFEGLYGFAPGYVGHSEYVKEFEEGGLIVKIIKGSYYPTEKLINALRETEQW